MQQRPKALDGLAVLVFDFDGVILESVDIKTEAFLSLFADRPEHLEAIQAHHEANVGLSRYVKFEWIYRELFRESLSEEELRHLGERYSEIVFEKVLACPEVPGARALLAALEDRRPLYVASGTPESELRSIVRERGLDSFFVDVRGTPDRKPKILRQILGAEGCRPEEMLMIGDGGTDLAAADEVGARFAGRLLDGRESPFGDRELPLVHDLFDLGEWLGLDRESLS